MPGWRRFWTAEYARLRGARDSSGAYLHVEHFVGLNRAEMSTARAARPMVRY